MESSSRSTPKSCWRRGKNCNGNMTQAHFIAQKGTEWQRDAPEEWKTEQPSFLVQTGLPSLWWDCALEFYCFLVDVQDKMADNRTALEKNV